MKNEMCVAHRKGTFMTKEEFAELVLESTDSLYRVSKGILKNDEDCEDAVWEAVSIAFAKLDTLRQPEFAKTWLIRILIHECYRVLRERKHYASADAELLGEEEKSSMAYFDLYEALHSMEEKYRLPLVMFYLEGYSIREIAQILDSTEGTVKSWLGRGRKMLRKRMEA